MKKAPPKGSTTEDVEATNSPVCIGLSCSDLYWCVCAQSCLTLCNPMSCSPRDSSVCGILQARIWSGLQFPTPGDLPGVFLGSPGVGNWTQVSRVTCTGRWVPYPAPPGKPLWFVLHEPIFLICLGNLSRVFCYLHLKSWHLEVGVLSKLDSPILVIL